MHTLDGVPTRPSLKAGYNASSEHLKVDLEADEPGGGLVDGLLGLPGSPALRLEAKARVRCRIGKATLPAAAGSLASVDADVGLSGRDSLARAVVGKANAQVCCRRTWRH